MSRANDPRLEQRPTPWAEQAVERLTKADATFRQARDAAEQAPDDPTRLDAVVGRGAELGVAAAIVGRDPQARDLAEARGIDIDAVFDDVRDVAEQAQARARDDTMSHAQGRNLGRSREQHEAALAAELAPDLDLGHELAR